MSESQPLQETARKLVLVADDEPSYHLVIAHVLAALDLISLVAKNGAAAIALAKAHKEELRGAILDIAMPGVDGIDAAHVIQQLAPKRAIILVSGQNPADYATRIASLRLAGTLQKPFSLVALRALIWHTMVDSAASILPMDIGGQMPA